MKNKFHASQQLRDLPLSFKFSILVSGIVVILGITSIFFVDSKVSDVLHSEHRERGLSIARYLETQCVDLIFTDNRIKLHQLFDTVKRTEKDIKYLFILGSEKKIFAHTFGEEGFPKVLLEANPIPEGKSFTYTHLQFNNDTNNIIDELNIPLLEGKAGELHIGLSETFIRQKIATLRIQLIITTSIISLLGIFAAFFFARIISKPLHSLSIASDNFGQGKLVPELPIAAHDEIGRLTATFNRMVTKIASSRVRQEQVEKALRDSKEDWERTFDAITDIVTLQTPDMCIVKSNTSGCITLGLPSDKIRGQHCYELFHGSSQPCPGCPLVKTQKTFSPYTKEMYHEKLGKTFLVSASPVLNEKGELTNIVHVATDITAIKASEEDRIRLKAAIDQASETVVITDVEGSIQYVNPAFERLTGYSREEAIGQNPKVLNSGKHDIQFFKKMWEDLTQGHVWKGRLSL